MPDCQCDRLDRMFDTKKAERDLRTYRKRGPDRSTRLLIDAIRATPVAGLDLLDIGGGIGVVELELMADGLARATDVDISPAYVQIAEEAARERGYAERVSHRVGDFVALAAEVDSADIVTLDRVICCYPDLTALGSRAAGHARQRLGLVHPHDRWWMRFGAALVNALGRPLGLPRFFIHRTDRLEAILAEAGLHRETQTGTLFWRVAVYRRARVPVGEGGVLRTGTSLGPARMPGQVSWQRDAAGPLSAVWRDLGGPHAADPPSRAAAINASRSPRASGDSPGSSSRTMRWPPQRRRAAIRPRSAPDIGRVS